MMDSKRSGRIVKRLRWLLVLSALSGLVALAQPVTTADDEEKPLDVFEGSLMQFTGYFCCGPGYRFWLDGDCHMPVGILGAVGLGLEDYVGFRLRLNGYAQRCPPLPLCPCWLKDPADRPEPAGIPELPGGRDCLVIEAIEIIDQCTPVEKGPPANAL